MDDLIRRQDAIELLSDMLHWEHYDKATVQECIAIIRDVAGAQPERKTGFWIPQDFNKSSGFITTTVYYYPKCSICGWTSNYTNFCPNCGAQMKEEADG